MKKMDETSKALGMNRSELLEHMINQGWTLSEDLIDLVDKIAALQEEANAKMKRSKKWKK